MIDPGSLCPGCFLAPANRDGPCDRCGYAWDPNAFRTALRPRTLLNGGRYVVGRVLGRPGGFGVTYLSWDQVLERRIALKELLPRVLVAREPDGTTVRVQTSSDETQFRDTLEAFLNEARMVARFRHPNVVQVLDFFEGNGTAYFGMDYYDGCTLADYQAKKGPRLRWQEAIEAVDPVLQALDVVHSAGVLHRDIKPTNIYLTEDTRPILLDFGTARVALAGETKTLTAFHSPGYTPPEQLIAGRQGPWTDVYGVAATLYALTTGVTPADATMPGKMVAPVHRLAPDVPEWVSQAIAKGLARDWRERPSTAGSFLGELTGRDATPAEAVTKVWNPAMGGDVPRGDDRPTALASDDATAIASYDETALSPASAHVAGAVGVSAPMRKGPVPQRASRAARGGARWALAAACVVVLAGAAWGGFQLVNRGKQPVADRPAMGSADRSGRSLDPGPRTAAVNPRSQNDGRGATDAGSTDRAAGEAVSATPPPAVADPAGQGRPATETRQPAAVTTSGPPTEEVSSPPPPPTALAVLVYGDDAPSVEGVLSTGLLGAGGLTLLNPTSLEILRGKAGGGAGIGAFAATARAQGVAYMVVADVTTSAAPSVGSRFAGGAQLSATIYRISDGAIVTSTTVRSGAGGQGRPSVGFSEGTARSAAAEAVARMASDEIRRWLSTNVD